MQNAFWITQGAEQLRQLPVPPWLFGLGAFGLLLVLLTGVLAYGKGRPHS